MRRPRVPEVAAAALLALAPACQAPSGSAVFDPEQPRVHARDERGYDALHYSLEFRIEPGRWGFEGRTLIQMRAGRTLDEVVLDAADMRILDVRVHDELEQAGAATRRRAQQGAAGQTQRAAGGAAQQKPEPFWDYDGRRLRVPLERARHEGERLVVAVDYRTEEPLGGMHFVLGNRGTAAGDWPPHVFTQGECERSRFWFPCHDVPWDRATHSITATVPRTWSTVAAGERVQRVVTADELWAVVTWSLDQEMPTYLFTFAAGPFVKAEDQWEDVAITHYVLPEDLDEADASFARTPDVLRFMSEYTGFRYPFGKYAHVAVRDFPFGGMENVTATTVTRHALHPASEQEARPTWGLVAHEAAHQWFGDVVTCETWPHIWLNEGFATYFTQLYRRDAFGEQEFLYHMGRTVDGYLRACRGDRLRALVKHEYRMPFELFFDGTVYPGGASRLQLLRGMLGEATFRDGIRRYLHANAFRSVNSDDLRAAMEAASGRDLETFFRQWVHAPGYPELEVSWTQSGGELELTVRQTQDVAAGVPAAFRFPLDVRWHEGGSWRETRFQVEEREHSFRVETGGRFDGWVEVDPHAWVPAQLTVHEPAAATRLRAVQGWSSRSRALAVRALADYDDAETMDALWAVAREDAVPGLRAQAARELGRRLAGDAGQLPRLMASYDLEEHDAVQAAWWSQIARFAGHPAAHELLLRRLEDPLARTGERVTAMRALGRGLSGDELRGFALQALDGDPGDGLRLHVTALGLLGSLRDREARATLVPYAWSGHPTPVRAAALRELAHWLEDFDPEDAGHQAVHDAFQQALMSPSAVLRQTAARAVAPHKELFAAEVAELLRRDPDTRVRRALE